MILPSRRAKLWLGVGLVVLAALVASYLRYTLTSSLVHGGTPMGLFYGVFAVVLVCVLLAFGMRKRSYRSTWGTLDGWLQAHLYLGLLSAVVTLFHAGFHFRDLMATAAAGVLFAVVLSGFLGARLYATLPRRLTQVQSDLTAEEISEELNRLAEAMARIGGSRSALFQRIADGLLKTVRPATLAGWRLLLGSGLKEGDNHWRGLLKQLDPDEREPMRQLLVLYRQHWELHQRLRYKKRYKNLLEVWLYMHLPLSIILVLLIAAHVVAVFYFGAV